MEGNLITPFTKELSSTVFQGCTRYRGQTEAFFLDVVALNPDLGRYQVRMILHIKSGKTFLHETVETVKKNVIFESGCFRGVDAQDGSRFFLEAKDFVCTKANVYEYADRGDGLYFKAHFEGSVGKEQAERLISFSNQINGGAA